MAGTKSSGSAFRSKLLSSLPIVAEVAAICDFLFLDVVDTLALLPGLADTVSPLPAPGPGLFKSPR